MVKAVKCQNISRKSQRAFYDKSNVFEVEVFEGKIRLTEILLKEIILFGVLLRFFLEGGGGSSK